MPVIGSTSKSAWKTISDYRRSCICDSWRDDFCSACKKERILAPGVKYTSKKILQYAVVLLGFGMNLKVVMETGKQSLPIIICTITVSLVIAYVLHRVLRIPAKISTLVGVGSSICGGSAIAATAPVIDADDTEVARPFPLSFSSTSLLLYYSLYLDTSSALTQRAVLPSDCSPEQQLMTLLL